MEEPKVEEDKVEAIMADSALHRAFRRLEDSPPAGEPIPRQELLAYHLGELSEDEAGALRARLVWDREALSYLRELGNPAEPDLETPERGPAEIDEDWQAIQSLVGRADDHAPSETPGNEKRPSPPLPSPFPWYRRVEIFRRIAAVLALMVLGLGWRLEVLDDRLASQSAPDADVALIPISPTESTTGRRNLSPMDRVLLPARSNHAVLLLSYAGFETFDSYRAVLFHESAQGPDQGFDLGTVARTPEGGFNIYLSRSWVRSGAYELRLFGSKKQEELQLASYRFTVDVQ